MCWYGPTKYASRIHRVDSGSKDRRLLRLLTAVAPLTWTWASCSRGQTQTMVHAVRRPDHMVDSVHDGDWCARCRIYMYIVYSTVAVCN